MSRLFESSSEFSARTGFSGNRLDRLSERREDAAYLAALRSDPASRVALFFEDAPILIDRGKGRDPFLSFTEAESIGPLKDLSLLGRTPERALFAAAVDSRRDPGPTTPIEAIDLRSLAAQGLIDDAALGALAQGKSLIYWHTRHRYCPSCGAPTTLAAAGWRRECGACKALHFPRADPVVIMLAVQGEFCLLGRQARFAPGMYSALAGFVEPGETVEDAVRREIREETGVHVGRVAYVGSQPWPFPCSLMLGCLAEAITREIVVDRLELEDARWFTRGQARALFGETHPEGLRAPNPIAIAHRLILAWLDS